MIVALARRRAELPVTIEHFDAGRLSLEQAAVVGRHVPAAYEASVADMAQYATVPQVQRAVGKYPFVDPPADPYEPKPLRKCAPEPAKEPARLTTSFDGVGGFALRYTGDACVGALIEAALKEAKDARFRGDGTQLSMGQVFEQIMTGHLHQATKDTPSRRDLFRVLVHLDVPAMRTATSPGRRTPLVRTSQPPEPPEALEHPVPLEHLEPLEHPVPPEPLEPLEHPVPLEPLVPLGVAGWARLVRARWRRVAMAWWGG